MEFKQETIGKILDSEREAVVTAPVRYGKYFEHALSCSTFLSRFLESVDPSRDIFASLLTRVKKHHLLALLSTVRLHKVQSMMNLRQALEAGACAAFAIANPDHKHFVDTDKYGILDPSPRLAKKRYSWLRKNYAAGSDAIEEKKKQINETGTHANLINTHANFRADYSDGRFSEYFFDIEDEYVVKIDLWRVGSVALTLLDLFYGVNQDQNVIKFTDNFGPIFQTLVEKERALQAEMMATDRFKRASAMEKARKENGR
jgi:hypothetical protein